MKSLIYGNGESRQVWDITKSYKGFTTWGCNAIYRDAVVDNLVAIDYGVQQEIYESGYAIKNKCHFADWAILEDFDPEFLKMNYTPMDIHETEKSDIASCVVQGKERETAEKNYEEMMSKFPHLDKEDCKNKCYTNVGLYITWLKENDKNIKVLLSYADNGQGHVGGIYKATNWIYQGLSTDIALMPNWGISLTKDPHDWIHSRSVFNLWGSGNLEHLRKEIGKQGYKEFWRREEPPKHRYIQILAQSKKEKRDLMKRLKHETKPYPKEASEYNTEVVHHTTYEPDADREKTFW